MQNKTALMKAVAEAVNVRKEKAEETLDVILGLASELEAEPKTADALMKEILVKLGKGQKAEIKGIGCFSLIGGFPITADPGPVVDFAINDRFADVIRMAGVEQFAPGPKGGGGGMDD